MKIDVVIWGSIGALIGYLIGKVPGALIGALLCAALYKAASWWMDRHYDPDAVGPPAP